MAFYGDFGNQKSREEKRKSAEMRGGFEDEGSRYSDASKAARPARGQKAGPGDKPARGGELPRGRESGQAGGPAQGRKPPRRGQAPRPQRDAQPGGSFRGEGGRTFGNAPSGPAGQRDSRGPGKAYEGRPPMTGGGRKSNPRKGEGGFRFAKDASQRYSDRGAGTKPRPYGEQRDAQRDAEHGYRSYQYAPRPLPGRAPMDGLDPRHAPAAYAAPLDGGLVEQVPPENLLSGRNPIREALKSGRDIEKLLVARGELSGSAREIVQTARERHIPVQEVDRARLDAITHNHQGMLAFASAHEYRTVQDMLDLAASREEAPFLVLLDGITDPHNLGAIIRTAECAGAHGIIVQERRAVGLTPAAVKASAGAVEYLPVARVTNLTNTLLELKAKGIWAYAADMAGEDYGKVDFSGPVALVIGAEGEGVSRRVLDTCDRRVSLPIRGQIDSLNASVAAGVLLYAAMQAR